MLSVLQIGRWNICRKNSGVSVILYFLNPFIARPAPPGFAQWQKNAKQNGNKITCNILRYIKDKKCHYRQWIANRQSRGQNLGKPNPKYQDHLTNLQQQNQPPKPTWHEKNTHTNPPHKTTILACTFWPKKSTNHPLATNKLIAYRDKERGKGKEKGGG